ncbi:MAG TPA: hypothetical protein VFJ99_00765, partial [Solirubrobacterales bacterium]|nr:hypothetical protein [Solirubrobacterales bacterium]
MPLRSVEAATREDAIAAAREQFGASARVVGVRRVRSGGVLGFFATERYVAEVDPEQSNRPPVPAPSRSPARGGAPSRNGAAAYAAEALASEYDDDAYDSSGSYDSYDSYGDGRGRYDDLRDRFDERARLDDRLRSRYDRMDDEPEPVRPRSKLTPAERIAAASAMDAPARRPDDASRLEELAGLLGA